MPKSDASVNFINPLIPAKAGTQAAFSLSSDVEDHTRIPHRSRLSPG
jgi:hypothetical protein